MKKLDPHSSIPLYRQLAKSLIAKIDSKVFKPGEKIPSIRELAKQYDVSNITVVRALEELRQHQYIYSIHGKGYFVSHHQIFRKYMPTQDGFSDMVEKEGMRPSSIVLRKQVQKAGQKIAEILGISVDSEIVLLERIRLVDRFPLCVQVSYLPHEICLDILDYDFTRFSLYHILREKYHVQVVKSHYTIQAGLAGPREIKHLQLQSPAAILWVRRWAYAATGRLFEFGETAYRADSFQINSPINEYELINDINPES